MPGIKNRAYVFNTGDVGTTVYTNEWLAITQIIFRGPSSGGDQATLQEADETLITRITADTANEDVVRRFNPHKWSRGLHLQKLDSGSLEIHFA